MLSDTPGRRLLGGGWAFWRAAKLLHEHDTESLAWGASYVNLAFAIELGLKGFLRERGLTEKEQRALNHNLKKAFEKALEYDFSPSHEAQKTLVIELSPHHEDMSLRYAVGESVNLIRLEDAVLIVRGLLDDLHTQAKLLGPKG